MTYERREALGLASADLRTYLRVERPQGLLAIDMENPRPNAGAVGSILDQLVGLTLVGLVTFKLNLPLSRFVTEQLSRMSGLPVYRRQEAGVDRPYALAKRLGAVVIRDILSDYEAGTTAAELAERYGVSRTGITNLLHSQGAAVRRRCGLSPADVDLAEQLYAAGWLLREIGVELGFSRDAVRRALLQRGVVMRSGYSSANRSKRLERHSGVGTRREARPSRKADAAGET